MLDQNICPSVLLECGFLTDKDDKAFITMDENQTAVAQKILTARVRYVQNREEHQTIGKDTIPQEKKQSNRITVTGNLSAQKESSDVSFSSQNPPLFILDGREVSKEEALRTDPSSVEFINVLKDTSATSKYGKKGQNGVVEIKTKDQKSNKDIIVQENGKTLGTGTLKNDSKTNTFEGTFTTVPSPNKDTIPKKEPIFERVEIEAAVNKKEWVNFLQKSLQPFIKEAKAKGTPPGTYTVNVKFLVKRDGSVSDFKALNDPGFGMAKKVVEIMKDSPKWYPAIQNGKTVNSYHTQPITFVIQKQ